MDKFKIFFTKVPKDIYENHIMVKLDELKNTGNF